MKATINIAGENKSVECNRDSGVLSKIVRQISLHSQALVHDVYCDKYLYTQLLNWPGLEHSNKTGKPFIKVQQYTLFLNLATQ